MAVETRVLCQRGTIAPASHPPRRLVARAATLTCPRRRHRGSRAVRRRAPRPALSRLIGSSSFPRLPDPPRAGRQHGADARRAQRRGRHRAAARAEWGGPRSRGRGARGARKRKVRDVLCVGLRLSPPSVSQHCSGGGGWRGTSPRPPLRHHRPACPPAPHHRCVTEAPHTHRGCDGDVTAMIPRHHPPPLPGRLAFGRYPSSAIRRSSSRCTTTSPRSPRCCEQPAPPARASRARRRLGPTW